MSYERLIWQDHVTEYINRVKVVENIDGSLTYEPVEGEIVQQGTPMNARNFNNMEEGILASGLLGTEVARALLHFDMSGEGIVKEESGEIELFNTAAYPFNNSETEVPLLVRRGGGDYIVTANVESINGGCAGRIVVSNKQAGGFSLAYTGGARSAVISYNVRGG